jgi:hypothetical protein
MVSRGYHECVNAFIEQIQLTSLREKDPFKVILQFQNRSLSLLLQHLARACCHIFLMVYHSIESSCVPFCKVVSHI